MGGVCFKGIGFIVGRGRGRVLLGWRERCGEDSSSEETADRKRKGGVEKKKKDCFLEPIEFISLCFSWTVRQVTGDEKVRDEKRYTKRRKGRRGGVGQVNDGM